MQPDHLGDVSFWYADIGLPKPRAALPGDAEADVCIIGAGYTGLWSAWYLKQAQPSLRVVVVEKEFAGFGASGRNGGWLTGGFAWNHGRYAETAGTDGVRAMVRAMNGTVDEVIGVAETQGIDADIRRTEELMVAVNPAQAIRLSEEVAHRRRWGEEERVFEIGADELRPRLRIPGAVSAMVVTNVARVQPAKLVRGLAAAVERTGVSIYEGTAVTSLEAGRVATPRGVVRAKVILRCTEGFSAGLPGLRRDWLPLNSAQIATEPLPAQVWDEIGWDGHQIVGDFANAYCYCQRTREGRITVGARGVPYRFGSSLDSNGAPDPETVRRLVAILHRHFPATKPYRVAHAWCGVLGVPRDWCATVGFDPATGTGWAGGYVGVGVSTSNLAGRTLTDLVLGRTTDLTRLPWVNRRTRPWEPEPLRWLGVHAMYALLNAADRAEARPGVTRPSWLGGLGNRLTGRG
ncbi:FAD-binding oxidoreductase [Rhodobacter sp. Har01]|uniref:NAD(P)/FAD-dependent oxidoreductase n=1 Tax=Rhodobacter sp. Har01 TaxID=2883999 RepID=UPI001D090E04|nr:FAD-binding oxidoreductase [Rhodobacter sp. Har01]MCB6176597.1 FAD-binding oxidoreductase [Rhodobacter sp. Har01]